MDGTGLEDGALLPIPVYWGRAGLLPSVDLSNALPVSSTEAPRREGKVSQALGSVIDWL